MPSQGRGRGRGRKATVRHTVSHSVDLSDPHHHPNSSINDTTHPPPTDTPNLNLNGTVQTIGNRLRKRRRTHSASFHDSPPVTKRSLPVQDTSGINPKRQDSASVPQTLHAMAAEGTQMLAGGVQPTLPSGSEVATNPHQNGRQPSEGETSPNYDAVIANIISHGEHVDNHYATRSYEGSSTLGAEPFQPISASFTLKTQSLPVLENLAIQILDVMAKSSYQEILAIATKPETDPGHAYATLKSLFDHTKKVYSIQEPFLNPFELGLVHGGQVDIIRKANIATFVSSVFGSQDVGFYHLNENFLDTFVADGNRLLKSQAQLFLELKTQAYISAVQNTDRSREEILEDLFPTNFDQLLLKRRPGAKQLAPSEAEFTQRARNRRRALLDDGMNADSIKTLPEKYVWEAFLRDISAYVSKNFEAITGITTPKAVRNGRSAKDVDPEESQHSEGHRRSSPRSKPQTDRLHSQTAIEPQPHVSAESSHAPFPNAPHTFTAQENMAERAQFAIQSFNNDPGSKSPQQSQTVDRPPAEDQPTNLPQQPPQVEIQYHFEHPLHPNVPAPPPPYYQNLAFHEQQWDGQGPSPGDLLHSSNSQQGIPYPSQSAPTQVLYEQARNATAAKASPNNRRTSNPSQRRAWTTEEETSLMAGLDRVKGPKWSQILGMFGPGGSINEVLKDRNQVQLKDKARNLKLFFLKSGIEVPYYLQFVTGEMKTRAPARAAKNDAKEDTTDEDRAHIETLMALAGGAPPPENDQSMPASGNQPGNPLPHGHVPTADMGITPRVNGATQDEVPIDPQVTGGTAVTFNADAPTDRIAEMPMQRTEVAQSQG